MGFIATNISNFVRVFRKGNKVQFIGLLAKVTVIDYLYKINGKRQYFLRIYTPPVIPYT